MWEDDWQRLTKRVDAWIHAANLALTHMDHVGALNEVANKAIAHESDQLIMSIDGLDVPPSLKKDLDEAKARLGGIYTTTVKEGKYVIGNRLIALLALRAPLDSASRESEEPRRRLIDRAFLHLNRTLVADADARKRWLTALNQEPRCEQLGALHLLSHGVYAFKADAMSGRTDLILQEPLELTEEVRSAAAMVLTEWKVVRGDDEAATKAREGRDQATRYAQVELAGFELRRHRYVVLVSRLPIVVPSPELLQGATCHFVNIAIERRSPSKEARGRRGSARTRSRS